VCKMFVFVDWVWKAGHYEPKYFEIVRMFLDRKDCCYSIHQIGNYKDVSCFHLLLHSCVLGFMPGNVKNSEASHEQLWN